MRQGHYTRHINRLRTHYRKKMTLLLEAISEVFGDSVSVHGGDAGLHILMDVHSPLSREELIERAGSAGIRLYSTRSSYYVASSFPEHELLLGFPTVPEDHFPAMMRKLKDLWDL
jgi:GntR family transcriptional regulator/MocR family aminotransferase